MNNESKCCDDCGRIEPIQLGYDKRTGMGVSGAIRSFCSNSSCECHNPAMSEVMKKVDEQVGDAVRRLGEEHAPEDWEKEVRAILLPCELVKDLEDQVVNQILDLLASREAAARREGAERIKADLDEIWRKYRIAPFDSSMTVIEKLKDALGEQIDYFAARSEGVNG